MDRLTAMELFVKIHEFGTLRRAAEELDISTAAATRHLVALENHLKVKLIDRNTRRLALTSAGHEYYKHCKNFLYELTEAESMISASVIEPEGTLTMTASVSFAKLYLAPLIPKFNQLYPKIKINIIGANRYYDILDSNIDLAVRTREFEPDSNITIKRLASTKRILAASPQYISQFGQPQTVADLDQHQLLIYSHANDPYHLKFTRGDEMVDYHCRPMMETNDGQIVCAAALASAGILIQPMYIIYDDLVSGKLIPLLQEWELPLLTINLAFQTRRYMPAKTRLFIDFLVNHFKEKEYERYWNMTRV